jgi:hypothetical protein
LSRSIPAKTPAEPTPAELTAPAREAMLHNAAVRALDDPIALARAARIVRAAIERGRLTPDDITPPDAA